MKILVAEDDFASRNFLQFLLKKYGEVDIAVNGIEVLEAFRAALESKEPYDIIFMDIMMPEKDGLEAAKEVREMEREFHVAAANEVSIIMATALSDVKTVFKAFNKSEATDYIVKPLTVDTVHAKLIEMGLLNDK
ncbi:response regulator [Maridesulfovibrio zosterae]|uniref:response regulator n=1 Tax=Maridesulfovibrio zosterae TaxID=82171 RepID=UPI00040B99CB|nr:response regulator [Maridesulfovibrio zosterae]